LALKDMASETERFLETWRSKQLQYTMVSTLLGKRHLGFAEITRRALLYTMRSLGLQDSGEAAGLVEAWDDLEPYPDVPGPLGQLKRKYRLAMLSNGDLASLRKLEHKLGVAFDSIISADTAKSYKPSPTIYTLAVKKLKLRPSSILHVAGSSFDWIGAKALGMRVAWVNREKLPTDEWEFRPDLVVEDFTELVTNLA